MCPLCLKKLTEFSVFKKICLESDAALRKSLQSNCCRSFKERGAGDDNSGPYVETKGCIQDVIENNSQLTCSSQTTEIYLPVPDLVLPRDNELFHVKDKDEGNLSEGNYPVLYTSDPAGISTDVSDPLATDELVSLLVPCTVLFFYCTISFLCGKFPTPLIGNSDRVI
ncbi:uncharacterized protein LOC124172120 [Ischnura elegans]|uniref:uncharacterized protein LOC124172120 n=1 Tax=Ischnura elegans TaxID=197161 RepID=UPI001ED86E00|nr:uncharacterized protein LOC124172120 [Ischnura elegans]